MIFFSKLNIFLVFDKKNDFQEIYFFNALKKNPFLEKLFLSKTQKILSFEKKSLTTLFFYSKFRKKWYMCAHCSNSGI